jgi:hypothetical protein
MAKYIKTDAARRLTSLHLKAIPLKSSFSSAFVDARDPATYKLIDLNIIECHQVDLAKVLGSKLGQQLKSVTIRHDFPENSMKSLPTNGNPMLEKINLDFSGTSNDIGFEALFSFYAKSLKHFSFARMLLFAPSLKALRNLINLEIVDLSVALARYDEGTALAGALSCMPKLHTLILDKSQIHDETSFWVKDNRHKLTYYSARMCSKLSRNGIKALQAAKNSSRMEVIELNTVLSDEVLKAVSDMPAFSRVTQLSLRSNHEISSKGMVWIASSVNASNITKIILDSTLVDDEGIKTLAISTNLTKLAELSLQSCPITSEGLKALTNANFIGTLTSVDLTNTDLGEAGVAVLMKTKVPKLKSLRLGGWKSVAEDTWNSFIKECDIISHVEDLSLSECRLGLSTLLQIMNRSSLRSLDLSNVPMPYETGWVQFIQMAGLWNLKTLNLSGNYFGDQAVSVLVQNTRFRTLEELDLSFCKGLTVKSVDSLANAATSAMMMLRKVGIKGLMPLIQAGPRSKRPFLFQGV